VPESEQARVIATLVSAFTNDPVERWLFPEPQAYLSHFPKFVAAFGGQAFRDGTVWMLGEFSAVALWLAPGSEPDGDAIVNALSEGVSPEKHPDSFAVLEQMDRCHPEYPHWYLPWLGVAHAMQGGGLGGELLKRCLAIVDESHLPTYLETPNPRTVPLYERHGFQIIDVAQAGACPPITLMLRAAQ
jgi:GNAT superfamily N-acetyltransferase